MKGRIALAAVTVLGAATLLPFIAGAGSADLVDGNDTRGLLDVRLVDASKGMRPRFKVRTYSGWTVRRIYDKGFALIYLDMFGSKRFDYYALARAKGTRLKGLLFRDRKTKKDYVVSRLRTSKPGPRTLAMIVPLGKMRWPEARSFYRWAVQTLYTGKRCPRVCFDFAPNKGAVTEQRPGAPSSPTVSPTVSPTATPTVSPTTTPTTSPSPTPTTP